MEQQRQSIGILGFGAMGAGVAASLRRQGWPVATCVEGRSEASRERARAADVLCLGSLAELVSAVDLFVSLVPADQAEPLAVAVAAALNGSPARGRPLHFVDANSITPSKTGRIAGTVTAARAVFSDAGVIGPPPQAGSGSLRTRVYVSGPASEPLQLLATPEMSVTRLDDGLTTATEMKVLFAAINKGTVALLANVLAAARVAGLEDAIRRELGGERSALLGIIDGQASSIPSKALRWAIEMDDLADALQDLGVERGFHDAAASGYRRLAAALETDSGGTGQSDIDRILDGWLGPR